MPPTTTRSRRSRKAPVEYPEGSSEPEAPVDKSASTPAPAAEELQLPASPSARTIDPPRPMVPSDAAGTFALAIMTDDEFEQRLATLKRGRDRIAQIQRDLMEQDIDYGLIPGTPKPTLFKPGAEKLAQIYGLAADVRTNFTSGDGEHTPPLMYDAECYLHLGSFGGQIVAVGHGTASSWEKRYKRGAAKNCPNCGKPAIIKGKAEYGGGWICFKKKDGCSSKFRDDDERITSQVSDAKGDPAEAYDLGNTLLKMAEKRAFVDAVLRATASSSLFTQDLAEEPVRDEPITRPSGRIVDTSTGEVVEEVEEVEPEVRTADVGEVQRGGHRPTVTTAQIQQVQDASKALWGKQKGIGPYRVADEIAAIFGGGLDSTMLSDEPKDAAGEVMDFLQAMDPDDMGKLITHLKGLQVATE